MGEEVTISKNLFSFFKRLLSLSQQLLRKTSPNIPGILFFIIASILLPIFFNEAVQPIGSSRISTLSTEPLYIQSSVVVDEDNRVNTDYYQISKISYQIQPPMLPKNHGFCTFLLSKWLMKVVSVECDDKLSLDLPEDIEIFAPGSGFWEKNPYITVPTEEPPFNQNFISSREYNSISLGIETTAAVVKTIPFNLYYREMIEMSCESPGFTKTPWWNRRGSSLEEIPRVDCSTRHLARGWLMPQNRIIIYDFYELVLSNRGNLDIRGLTPTIRTTHYTEVCEDNKNVNIIGSGDKRNHIQIELKAGETRKMIILNQYSEEESKEELGYTSWQPKEINFTHAGCNGDWKDQIS